MWVPSPQMLNTLGWGGNSNNAAQLSGSRVGFDFIGVTALWDPFSPPSLSFREGEGCGERGGPLNPKEVQQVTAGVPLPPSPG